MKDPGDEWGCRIIDRGDGTGWRGGTDWDLLLLARARSPLRPQASVVRTRGGAIEALGRCKKECRKYEIALDGRGKSGDQY